MKPAGRAMLLRPLLHDQPAALLGAEIECPHGRGFGCLRARCCHVTEHLRLAADQPALAVPTAIACMSKLNALGWQTKIFRSTDFHSILWEWQTVTLGNTTLLTAI
jgi:hypothetical protein